MNKVIVRYRLRPGRDVENKKLVQSLFAELELKSPPGVAYASFQSEDSLTFFHIAFIERGMERTIPELPAFKEFQRSLAERCEEKPAVTAVSEVGSYKFVELAT